MVDAISPLQAIEANLRRQNSLAVWIYRAIGAAIAIGLMEFLANFAGEPLARVPFVTSIVLVMALPASEAARPRAILGGHLISCLCGLLCLWIIGPGEISSAAAVGLATFFMIAARAVHPPAGIDAFLVPAHHLPAAWLLSPVLPGALLLVGYSQLWRLAERRLFKRSLV